MKKFKKYDQDFECENCHFQVPKLNYTSRDHCPNCLYSKHLDIYPGDRANNCHGIMEPIGIEKFKNTYKIIYKCLKCHKIHKNIMAEDDNYNIIIKLSVIEK